MLAGKDSGSSREPPPEKRLSLDPESVWSRFCGSHRPEGACILRMSCPPRFSLKDSEVTFRDPGTADSEAHLLEHIGSVT